MKEKNFVSTDLVEVALNKVEGNSFEKFCNSFFSAMMGSVFVPLGGSKDGGADGFCESEIYASDRKGMFYQFTIQSDHRSKIRGTVKRLREVGRDPKTVYYITSKLVPHIDIEEENLSEELSILVRIRDKNYIINHINDSEGTKAAFKNYLEQYILFLRNIGAATTITASPYVNDPSVYVFLQQEVSNRLENSTLLQAMADSLILWALNDTDSDGGIFLNRDEILGKILSYFPWAKSFMRGQIDIRLKALRSKKVSKREVSWYKKQSHYCLPYETRSTIQLENARDEAIKRLYKN